jgi:hypothetical protein
LPQRGSNIKVRRLTLFPADQIMLDCSQDTCKSKQMGPSDSFGGLRGTGLICARLFAISVC